MLGRRHATQLEERLTRSQEQLQQQQQEAAAAQSADAAVRIAALEADLAESKAAALKLEQELTSHQYKVEVSMALWTCSAGHAIWLPTGAEHELEEPVWWSARMRSSMVCALQQPLQQVFLLTTLAMQLCMLR